MPLGFVGKIRTLFSGREPGAKKRIERLPRYLIQGSVIYRPLGELEWYKGKTENLSSSGVLFRGESPIPVDTTIEMTITPPPSGPKRIPEGVFCWGKVVRTAPREEMPTPTLAAKILKFRTKPKFLTDAETLYKRMD